MEKQKRKEKEKKKKKRKTKMKPDVINRSKRTIITLSYRKMRMHLD